MLKTISPGSIQKLGTPLGAFPSLAIVQLANKSIPNLRKLKILGGEFNVLTNLLSSPQIHLVKLFANLDNVVEESESLDKDYWQKK